jgi:hypothetical protein
MRTVFPRSNSAYGSAKNNPLTVGTNALSFGQNQDIYLATFTKDYNSLIASAGTARAGTLFDEIVRLDPSAASEFVGTIFKGLDLDKLVELFWDVYPASVVPDTGTTFNI